MFIHNLFMNVLKVLRIPLYIFLHFDVRSNVITFKLLCYAGYFMSI